MIVITPSERSDDSRLSSTLQVVGILLTVAGLRRRSGLWALVESRRPFAGFPRARGKRWAGSFLLSLEAVHGFPQPASVHRPIGAKRRRSSFRLGCGLGGCSGAAYGWALEFETMRVVEQAIADGVGQVGVADDAVPVLGGKLAGDQGGGTLTAVLHDLDQVAAFSVAQGGQQPVVNGQQVEPGQACQEALVGPVAARDGELL